MRAAGQGEQFDQLPQFRGRKVTKLPVVAGAHLGVDLDQQRHSLGRDPNLHDPTIFRQTLAFNQPPLM